MGPVRDDGEGRSGKRSRNLQTVQPGQRINFVQRQREGIIRR